MRGDWTEAVRLLERRPVFENAMLFFRIDIARLAPSLRGGTFEAVRAFNSLSFGERERVRGIAIISVCRLLDAQESAKRFSLNPHSASHSPRIAAG